MKLKEIPVSIYNSAKLLALSSDSMVSESKEEIPVIVSLTSIPSRLSTLHITIRSLLNQDVRPKKIVLWLHKSLKNEIPKKLKTLESSLFEIMYSDLTCSHRKLIHSLKLYPNDIIITCDDDMIYRKNWLRLIYQEHKLKPSKIIANQTRYITYNKNGELQSYKRWVFDDNLKFNETAVIPIGAEGVLYPPKSLSEEVTNVELFLELAPKADDLWFKAMAILKGTISIQAENKTKSPIPIIGSQKHSLKKSNIGGDKNKTQWLAITDHFSITSNTFL
ncbi:zinc-binding alcohol dehydrogenase [Maribacter sp. SA7]|uniref:zinc-binding alcohol dehydrogenase n=1 Tax=Maribacter zhoushanensis TaxID=3030012 RepID=UPI0023EDFA5E|nr:zinc-binding alcohol dehydrogenase [Maribacter zhoushanensis]MDF4202426.1 zinc-binding alcohol dehydrogenase [Maribacter zhoushanensis]